MGASLSLNLECTQKIQNLRGFYLARLRLVKTRRQKDVSTCTAAMSRWACATLDCVQWCIVFNVQFYCACFLLCSLFNSACAIKDCFVLFAYAPFTTAAGYGFALSGEALLRRHGLTHLREQECSQKCVALICSLFLF